MAIPAADFRAGGGIILALLFGLYLLPVIVYVTAAIATVLVVREAAREAAPASDSVMEMDRK